MTNNSYLFLKSDTDLSFGNGPGLELDNRADRGTSMLWQSAYDSPVQAASPQFSFKPTLLEANYYAAVGDGKVAPHTVLKTVPVVVPVVVPVADRTVSSLHDLNRTVDPCKKTMTMNFLPGTEPAAPLRNDLHHWSYAGPGRAKEGHAIKHKIRRSVD